MRGKERNAMERTKKKAENAEIEKEARKYAKGKRENQ